MHDLVKEASQALAQQDAEKLERLVEEARTRIAIPMAINVGELTRASQILTRQLRAAERHLGLSPLKHSDGRSSPWEL